jgi:predicted metal-binding membrane protein
MNSRRPAGPPIMQLTARTRTTLVLLAGALAAWVVTIDRMRGMDEGPGTDLGGLGWYLGVWVTMTAAMMLPTALPAARSAARRAPRGPALLFTAGYLGVWTAFGLVAYAVYRLIGAAGIDQLAWDRAGPYAAGAVIAAAGLYELTPCKRASLRSCRSVRAAHPLPAGIEHGRDCVVCSGALMAVLFVLGVMSLFWMAVVAGAIFAEKVLPQGRRVVPAVAATLAVLGIWVAAAPGTVPGLTQPPASPSMQMER